ncbi:7-carboxy-7-deazaguanine synthase QueE [bacterium]|nr:7-carboxy-7-deazaguanine synthase QueE [bacterium]
MQKVKIKEIFTSIQGEGPYVGYNQLFIRFCECNLKCQYCDTDFNGEMIFTPQTLKEYTENKLTTVHSISLTGGEPLLFVDFLNEYLPFANKPIYLETNATLPKELEKIIDRVDIISADIKLPSASGMPSLFEVHDRFFETAKKHAKEIFAKIVFNEKITHDEIVQCTDLGKKHDIELILQPQTVSDKPYVSAKKSQEILNCFLQKYPHTRLIPQVHKFLGVE